jgi:hypothetical protein
VPKVIPALALLIQANWELSDGCGGKPLRSEPQFKGNAAYICIRVGDTKPRSRGRSTLDELDAYGDLSKITVEFLKRWAGEWKESRGSPTSQLEARDPLR